MSIAFCVTLMFVNSTTAKTKKFDKVTYQLVYQIVTDRETALSNASSMPIEKAQALWSELATRLDNLYQGHRINLGIGGERARNTTKLTNLIYVGLKSESDSISTSGLYRPR